MSNQVVTIGYLKTFVNGVISVNTTKSDSYCPTYAELTGGTLVQNYSAGTNPTNHKPGIRIPSCTVGVGYTNNQLVIRQDLQLLWYVLQSVDVSASPTTISCCGGSSTLSTTAYFNLSTKKENGITSASTNTSTVITASYSDDKSYTTISGNKITFSKNSVNYPSSTSAAARSTTVTSTYEYSGVTKTDTVSITQNSNSVGSWTWISDTTTSISVSPTSMSFESGGGSKSYSVTRYYTSYYERYDSCNTLMDTDTDSNSASVTPTSYNCTGGFTCTSSKVSCDTNTGSSRTGTLTVTWGGFSDTCSLSQGASQAGTSYGDPYNYDYYLSVSTPSGKISCDGGSATFTARYVTTWDYDWVTKNDAGEVTNSGTSSDSSSTNVTNSAEWSTTVGSVSKGTLTLGAYDEDTRRTATVTAKYNGYSDSDYVYQESCYEEPEDTGSTSCMNIEYSVPVALSSSVIVSFKDSSGAIIAAHTIPSTTGTTTKEICGLTNGKALTASCSDDTVTMSGGINFNFSAGTTEYITVQAPNSGPTGSTPCDCQTQTTINADVVLSVSMMGVLNGQYTYTTVATATLDKPVECGDAYITVYYGVGSYDNAATETITISEGDNNGSTGTQRTTSKEDDNCIYALRDGHSLTFDKTDCYKAGNINVTVASDCYCSGNEPEAPTVTSTTYSYSAVAQDFGECDTSTTAKVYATPTYHYSDGTSSSGTKSEISVAKTLTYRISSTETYKSDCPTNPNSYSRTVTINVEFRHNGSQQSVVTTATQDAGPCNTGSTVYEYTFKNCYSDRQISLFASNATPSGSHLQFAMLSALDGTAVTVLVTSNNGTMVNGSSSNSSSYAKIGDSVKVYSLTNTTNIWTLEETITLTASNRSFEYGCSSTPTSCTCSVTSISVSPTSHTFTSNSSKSFSVTIVDNDCSGCTNGFLVYNSSGTYVTSGTSSFSLSNQTGTFTIRAKDNTGKTCTVTTTKYTAPVYVFKFNNPTGGFDSTSTETHIIHKPVYEGGGPTTTLTSTKDGSNVGYTMSSNVNWITTSTASTTCSWTISKNTSTSSRSGTITLTQSGSNKTLTISVTQGGAPATCDCSTVSISCNPTNSYTTGNSVSTVVTVNAGSNCSTKWKAYSSSGSYLGGGESGGSLSRTTTGTVTFRSEACTGKTTTWTISKPECAKPTIRLSGSSDGYMLQSYSDTDEWCGTNPNVSISTSADYIGDGSDYTHYSPTTCSFEIANCAASITSFNLDSGGWILDSHSGLNSFGISFTIRPDAIVNATCTLSGSFTYLMQGTPFSGTFSISILFNG